jgi:hypothetical protein
MWKEVLQPVKATFPLLAGLFSTLIGSPLYSQQNIIANKDNTRPETTRQYDPAVRITALTATRFNGYNELQWNSISDNNVSKFIAEYSVDGVNFQTAGQIIPINGVNSLKHYTSDTRPFLYRIHTEDIQGRSYYSGNFLLDGRDTPPVKIYPTTVTGNVLNANAGFPVQRIIIVSSSGQQVLAKDMNGVNDFFQITIPSLNKGLYLVTFYGNGWISTSKFMVG